jgi:hypothetical protein
MVGLHKNKKQKSHRIHVLVAQMFLGHKPNKTYEIIVDHKDNNKLNNNLDNLQLITARENSSKDINKNSTVSRYIGVYKNRKNNTWYSQIKIKGRGTHLGCFKTELEAHEAYQKALSEINK